MRIRSAMGQRIVTVPEKVGRALIRSGRFVDVDAEAGAVAPQPKKTPRKRTYKRRDMRPEE